jgi:transcription elongation factor Elf1
MYPEPALIAAGYLRRRCCEAVEYACPECATPAHVISAADLANGYDCPVCGKKSEQLLARCGRCKESVAIPVREGERECQSVQAYRKGMDAPAFAPAGAIWAIKRRDGAKVEVAAESELRRRFSSGELDAEVLVCGRDESSFVKAGTSAAFRDVARAPVPAAPVPAPVVGGGRPATPSAKPPGLPTAPPPAPVGPTRPAVPAAGRPALPTVPPPALRPPFRPGHSPVPPRRGPVSVGEPRSESASAVKVCFGCFNILFLIAICVGFLWFMGGFLKSLFK